MRIYALLNRTEQIVRGVLSTMKSSGKIADFYVDSIPDDFKIEVYALKIIPVKSISVTVTVRNDKE